MLSYVLLAATQMCEVAESMLRQRHFPETGVCRKLATSLYTISDAVFLGANMEVHNMKDVRDVRDRCRKAADDLLDTLD